MIFLLCNVLCFDVMILMSLMSLMMILKVVGCSGVVV